MFLFSFDMFGVDFLERKIPELVLVGPSAGWGRLDSRIWRLQPEMQEGKSRPIRK